MEASIQEVARLAGTTSRAPRFAAHDGGVAGAAFVRDALVVYARENL